MDCSLPGSSFEVDKNSHSFHRPALLFSAILSIVPLCASQHFVDGSPHGFRTGATAPDSHTDVRTPRGERHLPSRVLFYKGDHCSPKTSRWSRLRHVPIPNQSREWDDQLWLCSYVQLLSCVWLCDPMDCSMPGFPVRYLLETALTHVHWVGDAIQPSHPLLPSFPPAFSLSQTQGLF